MTHLRKWETFAGDELGPCPEPGCQPGQVLNVHFNGHAVVLSRVCRFCWARFAPSRSAQLHCSKVCGERDSAHDTWVRETRRAAVFGQRGPALPRGGATLAASVDRFQLTLV